MPIEFLSKSSGLELAGVGRPITNLMHLIWLSRPDLRAAFDLRNIDGQLAFLSWADASIEREYGIKIGAANQVVPANGLSRLVNWVNNFRRRGGVAPSSGSPGATLIGYAAGVLGMGEHVRMSAETLQRTHTPFGILDIDPGPHHKRKGYADNFPMVDRNIYKANVFHVNADQMLHTLCQVGEEFFKNRYNIGFWAWELAKCPSEWLPVIEMVDEIWAPSRFIQSCFAEVTNKPVIFMPLCVELPKFEKIERKHFKLPQDSCLFLFTFDFHSYIDRKNPFAAIMAFKKAFPNRATRAGLVLKIMKGDPTSDKWQAMVDVIDGDARIFIIDEVMSRGEVLGLLDCCDCFVSLHRSEGFGRGPAESMYLGKPTIVTSYSGNMDFTRSGASLLVDHRLIPVEPGQYVFGDGQVWADPDIDHAARHMREVFEGTDHVKQLAENGKRLMREEFSYERVGDLMNSRLKEVGAT